MSEHHVSPIRTPRQLVIVAAVSLIAPVIVIALLAALVTSGRKGVNVDEKTVLTRIQPVGTVAIAGPRTVLSGSEVYAQVCKTCHEAGLAGAHKLGDKTAWSKVLAQGQLAAVANAIKGIRGMPPKGGNADLTDAEVDAAVVHLANATGANWKSTAAVPAASKPAATSAATAPTAAAAIAPAVPATSAAAPSDGKSVYDTACVACHMTGVAGAPKAGDKVAWASRLKSSNDAMVASVIKGKGAMPPKGGQAALSDAQVKSAVDYLLAQVK